MSLARGLSKIAGFHGQPAEDNREEVVKERGQCGREQTLDKGPELRVLDEFGLENWPDIAQVSKLGEEDGYEGVGNEIQHSEQGDPKFVDEAPPASGSGIERQILPNEVLGFRG